MALWGGRFEGSADELLQKLNDSIDFDKRMYAQDIAGSQAYAEALVSVGILTTKEYHVIVDGLNQVKEEFESDSFKIHASDEDIHTAVERRLTEIVGSVGGKLHTARSRNDQVATDFRLYVIGAYERIGWHVRQLQQVLMQKALNHLQTLIPGYTHLQPAQPITVAHWLMSFFWMLARDHERLQQAKGRASVMPLGSGALAGTPLDIDRDKIALTLGFSSISENSLDAVSDRDFVGEFLFVASMIGVHLSRLGEDIILYSNPALGYVTLDDRFSTGSSLMPQKRNADPMELARGKAGRIIGHLTGILTTLKGLPSGYNKDLQEDKEALFDTVDTLDALLPVVTGVIETLNINAGRTREALSEDMLATDLADYLVNKGVPFREAHHLVGQVVRAAETSQVSLSQLPLATLQTISDEFESDVGDWFDFDLSVSRRRAVGGTAPAAVTKQIEAAQRWLAAQVE
jgi:argininosuccinate lyase